MATQIETDEVQLLKNCIAKGRFGVFGQMLPLTPAVAQYLLDLNPDNRTASKTRVDMYARDITEGRWQMNGESIIISRDGFLNDGQHRCLAVCKAGTPIPAMFVFGVDRESRKTTDMGSAKNAGNFIAMDGVTNASTVSGIARLALAYEKSGSVDQAARLSNSAVLEYINANKDELVWIASKAQGAYKRGLTRMVGGSVWGFCYFACRRVSASLADEYYHALATGEMLESGDPAFVARQRLVNLDRAGRTPKSEVILHGWNAHRRGQKRQTLKVTGRLPDIT